MRSSLFSKKLAFATAGLTIIQTLPMTADSKGMWTGIVTAAFLLSQAFVDVFAPEKTETPPPSEATKEAP